MNNAHGLTKENLILTFPVGLRKNPSIAALGNVTMETLAKRPAEIRCLSIYPRIDELPEELLDILAYDFKVDWWDSNWTLEQKRRTLGSSWQVHRTLGTKAAVETAISAIYPKTEVQEWFEYGGEPYHFRLNVDLQEDQWTPERHRRLMRQLQYYKNLRSHLELLSYQFPVIQLRETAGAGYLRALRFLLRVVSYGTGTIALNGTRRLDGSWALNQTFRGLRWERMALRLPIREKLGAGGAALRLGGAATRTRERITTPELRICAGARNEAHAPFRQMACGVSARQDYRLTGELTRDTMWTLSGACRLDGTKKLNAAIAKEEI